MANEQFLDDMDYKTMTIDNIIDWCKDNGKVAWLKAKAAETYTDKNGKVSKITYFQIKKDFCETFMPEILPEKKEVKASMFDKIAAL